MAPLSKIRNQGGFVEIALVVIALGMLMVAGVFFYHKGRQPAQTLTNEGYTYTLDFPNSTEVSANNQKYLKSSDGTVIVSTKPATSNVDCSSHVVQQAMINGAQHPICTDNNRSVYTATFQYEGIWHNVTVFSPDLTKAVDQSRATQIIESVKIQP